LTPKQLSLFDQPTIGGIVREVKSAMNDAVKESSLSRDQVRDRMNELAKRQPASGIKSFLGDSGSCGRSQIGRRRQEHDRLKTQLHGRDRCQGSAEH
jgi:transposase InsO family protein